MFTSILGTQAFARSLKQGLRIKEREQRQARKLSRPVQWPQIIAALEQVRGEEWARFSQRHGGWGRDAALWFGRTHERLSLTSLGSLAGGLDYAAVSVAVRRFNQRLAGDAQLHSQIKKVVEQLLNVEMCP